MKKVLLFLLTALLILTMGCTKPVVKIDNPIITQQEEKPEVLITHEKLKQDTYTFDSIKIKEDSLNITVFYGGGCKKHVFSLTWEGSFAKSLPPQVDLFLYHDSDDDACEALIKKTLEFDLTPLKETYLEYFKDDGDIVVNVYDFNNNKHKVMYQIY